MQIVKIVLKPRGTIRIVKLTVSPADFLLLILQQDMLLLMGQLGCMETVMKKVTPKSKKYMIRKSHREGRPEPMVVQILFIDHAVVKKAQHHWQETLGFSSQP